MHASMLSVEMWAWRAAHLQATFTFLGACLDTGTGIWHGAAISLQWIADNLHCKKSCLDLQETLADLFVRPSNSSHPETWPTNLERKCQLMVIRDYSYNLYKFYDLNTLNTGILIKFYVNKSTLGKLLLFQSRRVIAILHLKNEALEKWSTWKMFLLSSSHAISARTENLSVCTEAFRNTYYLGILNWTEHLCCNLPLKEKKNNVQMNYEP